MERIRLFLIEDHPIVSKGILSLFEGDEGIEIVGQAHNASEGIDRINSGLRVDLILSDMNMPGKSGLELIRVLKQSHPCIKIVILTMLEEHTIILETISAGGDGFILKNDSIEELIFAVKHVANGGKYVSSSLTYNLLQAQTNCEHNRSPQTKIEFSDREMEVLNHIADGLTNHEMAEKLFASRRTIEGYRQKLLEKTGTSNTATLIRFAIQCRLIS